MRRSLLRFLASLVLLVAVVAGCGDDGSEASVSCDDVEPFGDFGEVTMTIDGDPTCLLLAETPEERARGLMEVTDLQGYPGMVFAYPAETEGAFWMRNTPMPLTIAYVDATGHVVSTADMEPCEDSPDCRSYPPDGPFQSAIEVPQGELEALGIDDEATITFVDDINPS